MTPQEVKLWVRLRELRRLGFHFRRQSPILSYVVDFNAAVGSLSSRLTEANMEAAKACDGTA
jgi:very-short-patch-repair endonuclease